MLTQHLLVQVAVEEVEQVRRQGKFLRRHISRNLCFEMTYPRNAPCCLTCSVVFTAQEHWRSLS